VSLEPLSLLSGAPHDVALTGQAGALTFGDLQQEAPRLLTYLEQLGLDLFARKPVAFVAEPTPRALSLAQALLTAAIPFVPLHPRWLPRERALALEGKPEHLLLEELPRRLPSAPSQRALAALLRPAPAEAILAIVFTSGSNGAPKGVCLSRGALLASARASAARLGWRADDRWLLNLPLAHVSGLGILVRCLAEKKPIVLPAAGPSGDPALLLGTLQNTEATLVSLVPTQLARLVEAGGKPPATLRLALVGGAPLSVALEQRALELGWPVAPTYGMTEAGSQVATRLPVLPHPPGERPSGSVGKLLEHLEARLSGSMLELRGPGLFSGYWGEAPRAPASWFATGDSAAFGASGELFVLGRTDDLVISGGENVHPQEVEAVAMELACVSSAFAFGVPDEEWGQALLCAVAPAVVTEAALAAHFAARLAPFKRPKRCFVLDELPLTQTGKLDRKEARLRLSQLLARSKGRP
jgi:O-succinylbenzoic acid--CoA ligase